MHHICIQFSINSMRWPSGLPGLGELLRRGWGLAHSTQDETHRTATGQPRDRWSQHDPWKLPVFAVWVGGCFKCLVDLDLWNNNRTNIKAYKSSKSSLEDDKIVVNWSICSLPSSMSIITSGALGPWLVKSRHIFGWWNHNVWRLNTGQIHEGQVYLDPVRIHWSDGEIWFLDAS